MLTMRSNNGLTREHDRQVRLHSVRTDLKLDMPPLIHLPDGEEYPYDSMAKLHLRNFEQVRARGNGDRCRKRTAGPFRLT